MPTRVRRRTPSHAIVVAYLALFIALGGVSYAAFKLPNNSVKSKHISSGQVKSQDVKNDGITGADVKESTLALLGSPVDVRTLVIPPITAGSGWTERAARCEEGEQLLGGGYGQTNALPNPGFGSTYNATFAGPGVVKPNPNFPEELPETIVEAAQPDETPDAYMLQMEFDGNASNPEVTVYAICTK